MPNCTSKQKCKNKLHLQKQRIEGDYIREKQKTQNLEGLIVKYAPQYLKSTGGIPTTSCAQQIVSK